MLPLDVRNVLVCLRYGIGDVVMALPALSALREALPAATITALANPPADELLEGDPRVDRLVPSSRWGLRHRWDGGSPAVRGEIADWVRSRGFDLILDASHAPAAIASAIWSLGIRTLEASAPEERDAIASGGTAAEAIRHAVRRGWGLDMPPGLQPELRLAPEHRAFAASLLEEIGGGDRAPTALSPVASLDLKRWPIARLARVGDALIEAGLGPVLVLEGPDRAAGERVVGAMRYGDQALRIGREHLLRTAAILERCRAVVCNDTGIMHMAAAVGTATVAVFGPTRPRLFLPARPNSIAVCAPDIVCPHREHPTLIPPRCWEGDRCLVADRGCIERTTVDDVLAALRRVIPELDRSRPHPRPRHGHYGVRAAAAVG